MRDDFAHGGIRESQIRYSPFVLLVLLTLLLIFVISLFSSPDMSLFFVNYRLTLPSRYVCSELVPGSGTGYVFIQLLFRFCSEKVVNPFIGPQGFG